MKHEIALNGCAPTPLAHYLKALGILRLVAEQKDPEVTGFWKNESFIIKTTLDKDALLRFFLEEYRPTPIIAPWNGGSGFYKDDKKNRTAMLRIRNSLGERLSNIRQAIGDAELVLLNIGLAKKPDDEKVKDKLIIMLRSTLSDNSINWLDAAINLTTNGRKPVPLLGKGGNEGRLEFSNNFLQKLALVIDVNTNKPTDKSRLWLEGALYGKTISQLEKGSPGMLLPFASGGPNATTGFEVDSKSTTSINPWDYVLMLEGAIVFVSAATRKLESNSNSSISCSFIVKAEGSGHGGLTFSDRNQAHDEVWIPIWTKPIGFIEIRSLFSESRATINKRNAANGLDFSRAIANLGINRGIQEFIRTGFLERRAPGQGYYVTAPLGRFYVRNKEQAKLIDDLEQLFFLSNLRDFAIDKKKGASGRIVSLVHQLENKLFELVRSDNPKTTQDILILLGQLQRALSISFKGQKAVSSPVPSLTPAWVFKANDGSTEFRLACALANLTAAGLPMKVHFSAISLDKNNKWTWDRDSRLVIWGEGRFERNMTALLRTRLLAAERMQFKDKPFDFHFGANSSDIAAYLNNTVDDSRIGDLAQGLALVKEFPRHLDGAADHRKESVLPGAYAVMKPFFVPDKILHRLEFLPQDRKLPQPGELLTWLAAGQTERAVNLAWAKLRNAGVALPAFPNQPPSVLGIDGERLLAALAIPIEYGQLAFSLRRIKHESAQIERTT